MNLATSRDREGLDAELDIIEHSRAKDLLTQKPAPPTQNAAAITK